MALFRRQAPTQQVGSQPRTDIPLYFTNSGDPVRELADQVIILSGEIQQEFAEQFGPSYEWRADLNEPAKFWFTRKPKAIFRPHFIGTISRQSDTWLWGWDNINDFPPSVVDVAERVRQVGEQIRCDDLTVAKQPVDHRPKLEVDYMYAAMAVSGLPVPVYFADDDTFFLLDNQAVFDLPRPSMPHIITMIMEPLQAGLITNHRLAVRGYATRRAGISFTESDQSIVVRAPDGDATISFDDLSRIVNIQGTVGPGE